MAFCRIDSVPIRLRSRVNRPDYVIVQDATIMQEVDVTDGLKPGGLLLINTDKNAHRLGLDGVNYRIATISADELARRILGRPIINTALLGAFAGLTGELSLAAAIQAVRSKFPGELGEKNILVVEAGYRNIKEAA